MLIGKVGCTNQDEEQNNFSDLLIWSEKDIPKMKPRLLAETGMISLLRNKFVRSEIIFCQRGHGPMPLNTTLQASLYICVLRLFWLTKYVLYLDEHMIARLFRVVSSHEFENYGMGNKTITKWYAWTSQAERSLTEKIVFLTENRNEIVPKWRSQWGLGQDPHWESRTSSKTS